MSISMVLVDSKLLSKIFKSFMVFLLFISVSNTNLFAQNYPPLFFPQQLREVSLGETLEFTITAQDPDSDPVTFTATGLPTGATFNTTTKAFSWTPTIVSTNTVTFIANDGQGNTISKNVDINSVEGGWYRVLKHDFENFRIGEIDFVTDSIGWIIGGEKTTSRQLIYKTIDGGNSWSKQTINNSNQNGNLLGSFFFDSDTAWVSSGTGEIWKTVDGNTWNIQVSGTTEQLYSIEFVDAKIGWAVGFNGTIIGTTDGGATWTAQTSATSNHLWEASFVDANTGWVSGNSGTILKTTDGGASWTTQTSGTSANLESIFFVDANSGWASGNSGTILNTIDGGTTWTSQTSGTTNVIYDIKFLDANIGWATGDLGLILKTPDGGINWNAQTTNTNDWLFSSKFVDANIGYAQGLQSVLKTYDGGSTWYSLQSSTSKISQFGSIYFADSDNGWATGYNDIVTTKDGGITWDWNYLEQDHNLKKAYFYDANTGWNLGAGMQKSTDGGITWSEIAGAPSSMMNIMFIDSNTGWVVGNGGNIYKTSNGGSNWSQQTSGISSQLSSLFFIDSNTGWTSGASGIILGTSDGGTTWTSLTSGTTTGINDIKFFDANNGWAVGYNTILKTTDGGATWSSITHGLAGALADLQDIYIIDQNIIKVFTSSGFVITEDGGTSWVGDYLTNSIPSVQANESFYIDESTAFVTTFNKYSGGIFKYTGINYSERDSLALVALYNSTDGANWTNNTNWLSNEPIASWYGVIVTSGRVTHLSLSSNQLTGSIPPEVGNLTNLIALHLYSNQLIGSIPNEISNLTNLSGLNLFNNQLSGNIPSAIGNMTSLRELLLHVNSLTGSIPVEIGNLTSMTRMGFSSNQLTGPIPPEVSNLTSLFHLGLSNNNLTGSIPTEIGNLNSLTTLSLDGNNLSGSIPTEIGNLNSLTKLSLDDNNLTGNIPAVIGNLNNLTVLNLSSNLLSGGIPSEITSLTNLTYLALGSNLLSGGIPSEIGNLTSLQYLFLYNNNFNDLPDITSLFPLELLNLKNNNFTFEDIEPNVGSGGTTIYSPQDSAGTTIDTVVTLNSTFLDTIHIGGSANLYQWYKDGNMMTGETDSILTLSNLSQSDFGSYTVHVTNTIVTGLTIYRTVNINIAGVSTINNLSSAGSLLSIPVMVNEDLSGKGVYSYQFEFLFDPAVLKFVSVDITNSDIINGNNLSINSNEPSAGLLKIAASSASELSGAGNLLNLTFGVSSSATLGSTSSYSFNNFMLNEGDVNLGAIGGETTISLLLGDVTENGVVTADDAVFVLQECVGKLTLNDNQYSVGDVTGNGALSAFDASYILKYSAVLITEFPSNTQFPKLLGFDVNTLNLEIIEEDKFILLKLNGESKSNIYSIEGLLDFENSGLEFVESTSQGNIIQSALKDKSIRFAIASAEELSNNISEFRFTKYDNFDIKKLQIRNLSVNEQAVDDGALLVSENMLPTEYALNSNYPNPFNPTTTISFSIPIASKVELSVYNASGQLVKTLVSASYDQGVHEAVWDGNNSNGQKVASGVYIYRIRAGSFTATQKMLLIK